MAVVHRIYASALFDAAKDRGALPTAREEFGDFIAMLEAVPELGAVLGNPQLDARAKSAVIEDLLQDADELVRNFLLLVVQKGRADDIEPIAREFEQLCAREEGVLEVELTTAFELTPEDRRAILHQIEQASGRRVDATSRVDPSLIGGLVLQAGSMRVDASVRGRLERLRHELASAQATSE